MNNGIESPWQEAGRVFLRNRAAVAGLVILIIILFAAIFGPSLYPVDPFEIVWAPLTPPLEESSLLLGTDYLGRDILAGLLHGARATLIVGITAALITVLLGLLIGGLAGFFRGIIDEILMRVTEFFLVLPPLLFAMIILTLFKPTFLTMIIAIGAVSWPSMARLTRGEFLKLGALDYVTAARSIGGKNIYIITRVILPNALPPLIVSATLLVGVAILYEAGLSFLGLSDPNVMSWGLVIGGSREYFIYAWWTATLPGMAIFITVLSVSLVGDGLNDSFNPKLRER